MNASLLNRNTIDVNYYKKGNPKRAAVPQGQAKVGSYLLAFIIPVILTFVTYFITK
ncbi:MAG: hypothetical protein IJY74_02670 [Oscillospiraceae bacterium]|nr:hypothetical protein [Oscillospiraceae bacterium]